MEVGFVISDSNTREFRFLVRRDARLDNNMFVITDSGVFGRVVDIDGMNNLLSDSDILVYYDEILKYMVPSRDNYNIARVKVYGNLKSSSVDRVNTPPYPGESVRVLEWNELRGLLGLSDSDDNIVIGKVLPYNQDIHIDPYRLIEKHFGVLAMSGAGKSNLISVLLQELTERDIKIPVVVFDIHNEYYNFSQVYPRKFTSIPSHTIKLSRTYLNSDIIGLLADDLTEVQSYILDDILSKLDNPSIDQLIDYIKHMVHESKEGQHRRSLQALLRRLQSIKSLDVFGDIGLEDKIALLRNGKSLVIDFSDAHNDRILTTKASVLLKELFERRKRGEIPPVLVIIEEAHLLASSETNRESRMSQMILTRIAREGRKFGICLGIVSQRPYYLNQTIMAQLNVQIFLRIVNPYDIDYVRSIGEQLTDDDMASIPNLLPGEAIVSGLLKYPLFVKFRLADQRLRSNYQNLRDMVKNYWSNRDQRYISNIDL
ncbi:MAG: ATP-binding protein [Candidatus Micrarchaeota archaeon]|nr:ATP-binding protein [Candidatus Micrarchaeota archaeon]MCX8154554.1 ATP-binding protein [Candidatus Micrarchaeota archaeon]